MTLDLLESRWKKQAAKNFAKKLDDFYVNSDFHEFYVTHQDLYDKTERRIAQITDKIDYSWFQSFYGNENSGHFKIILNFPSKDNGYSAACRYKDGHEEFFAIVGVNGPDANYNEDGFTSWVIHEFNHYFCNPLVDKHFKELQESAERHFALVAEKMKEQAYPSPKIMLYEYLTRACEIKHLQDHGKNEHADVRAESYCNLGFLLINDFVEALSRYERERDKYPTLDAFLPEIAKLLHDKVTEEFVAKYENHPKVVSTNPPIGSKDVDPALTEITVTFDQPMQKGCAWCTKDNNQTFPKTKGAEVRWSEDSKTCYLKNVELEPNKKYNIWINTTLTDNFRNVDDVPAKPILFNFTTGNGKSNPKSTRRRDGLE